MRRLRVEQNSFAAGEIAPTLLPGAAPEVYRKGARRLVNVVVRPSGAVSRRPGLRFVAAARGPGRLLAFEFNVEQVYLVLLTDLSLDVFAADGSLLASLATPFAFSRLPALNWTQSADTLLLVHPEVPPQRLTRSADGRWLLADWRIAAGASGRMLWPHHKFAAPGVRLIATASTGNIVIEATAEVFRAEHLGVRLRLNDREVTVTRVLSARYVEAVVHQALTQPLDTGDWSEQAWSRARGWPASVTFHQDRLAVGGSRDLPDRLWLSASGEPFDFDPGEGLDDEAIELVLLADEVNAIRHVVSGRHLQVFTGGGEWMVTGEPLTPTTIRVHPQTRIGSPVDRSVPPCDIDGATVFVARNDGQLGEFVFSDLEQAYRTLDLALAAPGLLRRPIAMDFDRAGRLLYVVLADGTLATLTLYREEGVVAWSRQETAGAVRAVAVVGDRVFVLVERPGGFFIEMFDAAVGSDAAITGTRPAPAIAWSGAGHLEGATVVAVADGVPLKGLLVGNGAVSLPRPAASVALGLPFSHVIEPLPVETGTAARRLRPIALTLRLLETAVLRIDVGRGLRDVPLAPPPATGAPPAPLTGRCRLALAGWRPAVAAPPWRIEQDTPLPFTLLSVSLELAIGA